MKKYYLQIIVLLGLHFFNNELNAGSFTEYHVVKCGDSMIIGKLGFPTWNPATILKKANKGYAVIIDEVPGQYALKYTAAPCAAYVDTVIVLCAKATQITCDTGYYLFSIECTQSIQDIRIFEVKCNDTVYTADLSGWAAPAITDSARYGMAQVVLEPTDGAGILYIPSTNYEGPDYVKVKTRFTSEILYIFNVYCKKTSFIKPVTKNKIIITPQHNARSFLIESETPMKPLQVIDNLGREISFFHTFIENRQAIQFCDIRDGIYYLLLKDTQNNKITVAKLPAIRLN